MEREIASIIDEGLTDGDYVLDLCCGIGNVTKHLKTKIECVGIDIHEPYVKKYISTTGHLALCDDALSRCRSISKNTYDVVMCIDGIEHFSKGRAIYIIKHMHRIAKKKIIIFTTDNWVYNNPKNTWGLGTFGDKYQEHLCGFKAKYFKERGYLLLKSYTYPNPYDGKDMTQLLVVKKV